MYTIGYLTIYIWCIHDLYIHQQCPFGKIGGPVRYTIYHPSPVVRGVNKPLYESTNQSEKDIYATFITIENGHL